MTRAQLDLFGERPATQPGMRRMVCRCDCGRWFYVPRGQRGRPLEYATDDCKRRANLKRVRERRRLWGRSDRP